MRALAVLALCAASLLLVIAAPAGADVFGPISLVSSDAIEQADYAHDPAISQNGEYVAFDGYFDGLTGVWRRDLESGAVEPVAVGEPETAAGSAELPSISKNGQYISFTTLAALSPQDDKNIGPDVYVRDMGAPESQPCEELALHPAQPCAFTLASAVNDSRQGLTYEYAHVQSLEFEQEHYGAMAAGRSALSANGQEVVFVTTTASNLSGEGTPELEVALRDLETDKTELVSVEYDPATGRPAIDEETGRPKPVPVQAEGSHTYGAVYSGGERLAFAAPAQYALTPQVAASISAEGTTVAWFGQDIGEQAQTLPAETLKPEYSEPLWRRVAAGEEAPTRRVTGGSDPANPACVASGERALPEQQSLSDPCQGPFSVEPDYGVWTGSTGGEADDIVPRLSADGYEVAFIANAPLVSLGNDFGVAKSARHSDLYIADMHEGLSRVQALTPLTELASGNETELATNAPIVDFGISPSGSQIAFSTMRTVFPLGSPAYVSAPAASPGLLELFDVDLADDTLTRVTHGYEDGPSEHPHSAATENREDPYEERKSDGALSPSFSEVFEGHETLAFSSTASNLVYGDGNTPPLENSISDGSDAFVVGRIVFGSTPTPQIISSPPPGPSLTPLWSLGVTAVSLRDGSVQLYVEVPGAGTLRAQASGAVAVRAVRASRGHRRTRVLTRDLAAATHVDDASAGGLTMLTLTLSPSYRSLATRSGGLSATASLTFTAAGHPALHDSIAVSFRHAATAPKRAVSARSRAKGHKRR
jgi:hypothetical protein